VRIESDVGAIEIRQLTRLYRFVALDVSVWSCSIAEEGVLVMDY
jgi:hypothetical protein